MHKRDVTLSLIKNLYSVHQYDYENAKESQHWLTFYRLEFQEYRHQFDSVNFPPDDFELLSF